MDQTTSIIFFFAAIFIVGGILFAIISFSRNSPKQLKQEYYRSQWLSIEAGVVQNDANTQLVALLNADKLLDKALQERGISGQTMGERMKSYQTKWTNANDIWTAHKLRNRLAHETDVKIEYRQTKRALQAFKQALKDVGAL